MFFHIEEPEHVPETLHYALLALFVLGGGLALVLYWKPVKDPIFPALCQAALHRRFLQLVGPKRVGRFGDVKRLG